jgi:hypothetical protein
MVAQVVFQLFPSGLILFWKELMYGLLMMSAKVNLGSIFHFESLFVDDFLK